MQDDSAISFPERETIELPELDSQSRDQSVLPRTIIWIAFLLIGGGAMYAMCFHGSRASGAMRADEMSASAPRDSPRLAEFLADGHLQLPALRAAMAEYGQSLHTLLTVSIRPQIPLTGLKCNPFHQPEPDATPGHSQPTTNPDAQAHPEAERAAMLQAVEAMQLQSILCTDSRRSCMIDNALYDEGGIINGFTIEQINAQTVVIRNGLYRFELTMNH